MLDPFMGSGTTIQVAKDLRRNVVGIDIQPEYYEMVKSQIEEKEFILFEPQEKYETTKHK